MRRSAVCGPCPTGVERALLGRGPASCTAPVSDTPAGVPEKRLDSEPQASLGTHVSSAENGADGGTGAERTD